MMMMMIVVMIVMKTKLHFVSNQRITLRKPFQMEIIIIIVIIIMMTINIINCMIEYL